MKPEPLPIDRLREFANYLTPRKGLLSADTWTLVAIIGRNLLLNWMVILPLLAFAALIPQVTFLFASAPALGRLGWAQIVSWLALFLAFQSSVATHWMRAKRRGRGRELDPDPERRWEQRRAEVASSRAFTLLSVGMLLAAATLLVLGAVWARDPWALVPGLGGFEFAAVRNLDDGVKGPFLLPMLWVSLWTIGLPLVGALIGKSATWQRPPLREQLVEAGAFVISGMIGAALLVWLMGGRG